MGRYAQEKTYPVVSVGPDELDWYDFEKVPDDFKWLVYWYEQESYEGSGMAIYQCEDGTHGSTDLGHCSCYGPTDERSWGSDGINAFGVRKILKLDPDMKDRIRRPEDYDYKRWAALAPAVEARLREEATR